MNSDSRLIFEKGYNHPNNNFIPKMDIEGSEIDNIIPKSLQREDLPIPDIPEIEIVRHFLNLSQKTYGVDTGIYPLGSCTMKYNPKINEVIARLPSFSQLHPLQEKNLGALEVIIELSKLLCQVTGMDGFTFQPAAGAHGELTGLLLIKKYFELRDLKKNAIIVPESAHGTNPASAKMAGFSIIKIRSNKNGEIPIDLLKFALEEDNVAGIMLTNPNTLGLFERNITEITQIVHDYGGLCYYDGANLNPILGICRPGDMGFDIIHLNLHKTFSTPHGGGGPGSGPVGVKKELIPFLPNPCIISNENEVQYNECSKNSVGRIKSFWGNFGVLLRAYAYLFALGGKGLRRVGEISVLNANYLQVQLKKKYHLPYKRTCMHEFVLSDKNLPNDITTEDIAKRILDYGIYAPTMYFPLIVSGAMMIEPTETESKASLDKFIDIMLNIYEEARTNPDIIKNAPHNTSVKRLDAVLAARKPVLHD